MPAIIGAMPTAANASDPVIANGMDTLPPLPTPGSGTSTRGTVWPYPTDENDVYSSSTYRMAVQSLFDQGAITAGDWALYFRQGTTFDHSIRGLLRWTRPAGVPPYVRLILQSRSNILLSVSSVTLDTTGLVVTLLWMNTSPPPAAPPPVPGTPPSPPLSSSASLQVTFLSGGSSTPFQTGAPIQYVSPSSTI